ncbi:MAG: glycerol-3-phosphate 1-O-acyltransferase PlsY [Gammaproteobacteria bacterium]
MSLYITIVILAYLLGSVASAVVVCRSLGLSDPRAAGSGNPGATNVLRLHGRKAAALTLIGDVLKAVPAILLLHYLQAPAAFIAAAGLAAFLGHLFPLYFGFRGGKGVATLVGILSATDWSLGVAFILTWLLVALVTRYVSLAAMVAAVLMPLYSYYLLPDNTAYIVSTALMSLAVLSRHRSNISNLLAGEEDKIGNIKQ